MSRSNGSNNIHTVTADDPPFLFHRGEGYTRHRLPVDSKVIYPNDPLEPVPDRRAAIESALDHPLGSDPLDALLAPGMKVTIAFDDVSLPLPRMAKPDIRQTVVEIVLERLDKAGVTDVELICAICLHRRITPAEMTHMLGKEIYRRFAPKKLYNHDAEDPEGNVDLGTTSTGEVVEINRRAAESDLIIYVNINMVTMDGGHKSVPVSRRIGASRTTTARTCCCTTRATWIRRTVLSTGRASGWAPWSPNTSRSSRSKRHSTATSSPICSDSCSDASMHGTFWTG